MLSTIKNPNSRVSNRVITQPQQNLVPETNSSISKPKIEFATGKTAIKESDSPKNLLH
jgi:hypothetical protein